jgi:putative ABC transport system permease protein
VTANGIAQSVRERLPEFAVLGAIGFQLRTLCALVVAEALVPCAAGALLGTGLAQLMTAWPARYLPHDLQGVPTPTISPLVWAWALAFAVGLALSGSVPPVLWLRSLAVSQAIARR